MANIYWAPFVNISFHFQIKSQSVTDLQSLIPCIQTQALYKLHRDTSGGCQGRICIVTRGLLVGSYRRSHNSKKLFTAFVQVFIRYSPQIHRPRTAPLLVSTQPPAGKPASMPSTLQFLLCTRSALSAYARGGGKTAQAGANCPPLADFLLSYLFKIEKQGVGIRKSGTARGEQLPTPATPKARPWLLILHYRTRG